MLLADAAAVITDGKERALGLFPRRVALHTHGDPGLSRTELQGIGDEIGQDLLDAPLIQVYHECLWPALYADQPARLRSLALNHARDEVNDVTRPPLGEGEHVGMQSAHIQQVSDQGGHQVSRRQHLVDELDRRSQATGHSPVAW